MDIQIIKKDIKSKLAKNVKESIYNIDQIINPGSDKYDDFIAVQSRYNSLLQQNSKGSLKDGEYQREYSKICDAILHLISELEIIDLILPQEDKNTELVEADTGYLSVEYGVTQISGNDYRISIAPTVFFSDRFSMAFPGVRGIEVFSNPAEALYRLSLLLNNPISFKEGGRHGVVLDPIWWFRGRKSLSIDKFEKISDSLAVLGRIEVYKPKVMIYYSSSYYRSFVYVRVRGNSPTGLYEYSENKIQEVKKILGYYSEEYAIFEGKNIKREEFDDGASVLDGVVVPIDGNAELRYRYLSDYNLIICAMYHPLNSIKISPEFEEIMNRLLDTGEENFQELVDFVERLPRNRYDD